MSGETDLAVLIKSMNPELSETDYVFCSIRSDSPILGKLRPWAMITEAEGITLVLQKEKADEYKIPYQSVFRRITLNIHSSLEAVGLTAKVSAKLMALGIGANVIAGCHHDHIFIPKEKAEKALKGLVELSKGDWV